MKLPQLLKSVDSDIENRKRAFQRREMSQAYRKNAQYQAPENPLLEALENLLSGKTERDLHTSGQAEENSLNTLGSSYQEVPQTVGEAEGMWKGQVDELGENVPVTADRAADFEKDEKVKAPELFTDMFTDYNVLHETALTGRQLESRTQHHLFELASASYLQHIAMVKNNYRSFDEPSYSKIA